MLLLLLLLLLRATASVLRLISTHELCWLAEAALCMVLEVFLVSESGKHVLKASVLA